MWRRMNQQALALSDLSFDDRCAAILTSMSAPFTFLLDLLAQADDAPQGEKRSKQYDPKVVATTYPCICLWVFANLLRRLEDPRDHTSSTLGRLGTTRLEKGAGTSAD